MTATFSTPSEVVAALDLTGLTRKDAAQAKRAALREWSQTHEFRAWHAAHEADKAARKAAGSFVADSYHGESYAGLALEAAGLIPVGGDQSRNVVKSARGTYARHIGSGRAANLTRQECLDLGLTPAGPGND